MVLPCDTCKRKTVKRSGHRVFIGCNDPELQRENFKEDTFFYIHQCTAYEEETAPEDKDEAQKQQPTPEGSH